MTSSQSDSNKTISFTPGFREYSVRYRKNTPGVLVKYVQGNS